ncbi:recombination directionality factor [Hydrogenophaga aquatica]
MLKGLALTPPVVGRISIGKVVEKNGKRLPEKDDEFTLTSQVQSRGSWVLHPMDEALRQAAGSASSTGSAKLRSIPVKLLFDDPDLNLRVGYTLFDRQTGRPLCVGNGQTCKRVGAGAVEGGDGVGGRAEAATLPCDGPDFCAYAQGQCKAFGRLNVRVGDEDELGTFVFRTTGFNSIRTLATRQRYLHAVSGGLLSNLPLELRLRGKSTAMSHRAPIYYVDLTLRSGASLAEAMLQARAERQARTETGWDQAALDQAAREGFACGVFEESEEDGVAVLEEFYPDDTGEDGPGDPVDPEDSNDSRAPQAAPHQRRGLRHKLAQKASVLGSGLASDRGIPPPGPVFPPVD